MKYKKYPQVTKPIPIPKTNHDTDLWDGDELETKNIGIFFFRFDKKFRDKAFETK